MQPDEAAGQPPASRYDPCFTAPVSFFLGACLVISSVGLFLHLGVTPVSGTVGGCLLLLGILLLAVACSPTLRLRLRMGVWPIATPSSLEEIQKLLAASPAPVAVGEGWGFFISRTLPQPSAIALRGQWSGLVAWESDLLRVRSGTVFGELVQILWSENKAAVDRPQFDQLSVGAAVRTCGHGWFAQGWFIDSVMALSAVERGTGQLVEVKRGDAKFWNVALGSEYVITEILLTSLPNRLLRIQQTVEKLQSSKESSAYSRLHKSSEWLTSPFKLMFVSASQVIRKWGVYLAPGEGTIDDEVKISGCDLRCRTIRRHLRIPEEYDLVDSVADAHTLIQTVWPVESVVERLAGSLNVELFVAKDFDWEASIEILAPFHAKHGGRTELRDRTCSGVTVTAFDVIMPVGVGFLSCSSCCSSSSGFQPWFDMLHTSFGVTSGSVHTGKYIPTSGGPVQLVAPLDFWPLVSKQPIGTEA